jgi:predicted HTH transcriptional regulator
MEKPSYYGILPANIRYDNRLKPNAKILYSEITAIIKKDGYCIATNQYFAILYKVSEETISRWISQLCEYGYVTREFEYKENSKEIAFRKLDVK